MAKKDYQDLCTSREQELNFQFLDRRNLTAYLREGLKISSVIKEIEEVYDSCLQLPKCCDGNIFNFITPKEFTEYIKSKYNITVEGNIVHLCN